MVLCYGALANKTKSLKDGKRQCLSGAFAWSIKFHA